MANKKWLTEYPWEKNNVERTFESLLTAAGYTITGYRAYMSKTDYRIEKDGITQEFSVNAAKDNSSRRGRLCFEMFEKYFNVTKEYMSLKAELESRK